MTNIPNIISNCCAGGYLYQKLNLSYGNPFIWSAMLPSDFIYLYQHFDEINFANITLSHSNMHGQGDIEKIRVDNVIDIHYTHYRLSLLDEMPRKAGLDLFYKYSYKYVVAKYRERLQRMNTSCGKPKFIICDNKVDLDWSIENFKTLFSVNRQYPIIIFSDKDLSCLKIPNHIVVIKQSGFFHDLCIDENYNFIKQWVTI